MNCEKNEVFRFFGDELFYISNEIKTPFYLISESALRHNLKILQDVKKRTGAKILLAQKAFSNFDFYPLLAEVLDGTTASGLFEARLGREKFGGLTEVFSPAYRDDEIDQIIALCDDIVLNSRAQFKKFAKKIKQAGKNVFLRINPEVSTQKTNEMYDPCSENSRLGVRKSELLEFSDRELSLLDGIHFHTLCEQNSDDLKTTLDVIKKDFGFILKSVRTLNIGGGHHITRDDYDRELLISCINDVKKEFNVDVIIEPGEAVALNAGVLITRVLDVKKTKSSFAVILDSSAACHMPDTLEVPYCPLVKCEKKLILNEEEREKTKTDLEKFFLCGPTCLSGDVLGEYFSNDQLFEGDLLMLGDMAIYTTCKNNTFNGVALPDIYRLCENGEIEKLTDFSYNDFLIRLGKTNLRKF